MTSNNIPLASAYRLNGVNFMESAKNLCGNLELCENGVPVKLTAVPYYFLSSHAAELFLKSALLKRGIEEKTLRNFEYRHNLEELLAKLISKGVVVSEDAQFIIKGLSSQHKEHALRYSVFEDNGRKSFWPSVPLVAGALDELLSLTRISTQGV